MSEASDYWNAEDFEETVAAALIACFETKIYKNRGAAPNDRLTEERLRIVRKIGPYIPSNSRLFWAPPEDDGPWQFDILNDRLPLQGCDAFRCTGMVAKERPDAYLMILYFRRVEALGKGWHARCAGTPYEIFFIEANARGITGERRFFTVASDGTLYCCDQRFQNDSRSSNFGRPAKVILLSDVQNEILQQTEIWASLSLQGLADRRFCWTITAQEQEARAHLGCMREEVKSLLYARSLPLSVTGRKRPILHLVEAHKRRMKSGIDIDITAFLRGCQRVDIGSTSFQVVPPAVLAPCVSKASQRFFSPASFV